MAANCQVATTDKRTDVWSRPSCIYTPIFSPPKNVFLLFRGQIFVLIFDKKVLCNFQCGPYSVFFKKKALTPKKFKNGPEKLLIIGPDPFIS